MGPDLEILCREAHICCVCWGNTSIDAKLEWARHFAAEAARAAADPALATQWRAELNLAAHGASSVLAGSRPVADLEQILSRLEGLPDA